MAKDFLARTIDEMALQLVFPGFTFGKDDPETAIRLTKLGVGGFCLYQGRVDEVAALTRRLQSISKIPLLFCADYEDGTASHVVGGTRFPSNMGIGASGREDLARRKAHITAVEAYAMGVRWVFAPVLDLATLPSNPIVNIRSFGSDPNLVSRMGKAFMEGLNEGGVLSCAKHFPGHGETEKDSHLELPVVNRTKRQLLDRELAPFARTRNVADSVMIAHLAVPALGDADGLPVSLSKKGIDGLLRRSLKFSGLVVMDALSMKAISDHYSDLEASSAALLAGVDILLVPEYPEQLAGVLSDYVKSEKGLHAKIRAAYRRLAKAKERCGLFSDRGLAPEKAIDQVGCAAHLAEAERMTAACLTWIREPQTPLSRTAYYLEPDSQTPQQWQGKMFVEELRSLGIDVRPFETGATEGSLIVASFLRPRAYSGRIQFTAEERQRAETGFKQTSNSVLVAFGSPFVMDELKGWHAGLCVFSAAEVAQKLAAWSLVGRLHVTGRLPLSLSQGRHQEPRSRREVYQRLEARSKSYDVRA